MTAAILFAKEVTKDETAEFLVFLGWATLGFFLGGIVGLPALIMGYIANEKSKAGGVWFTCFVIGGIPFVGVAVGLFISLTTSIYFWTLMRKPSQELVGPSSLKCRKCRGLVMPGEAYCDGCANRLRAGL